MSAYQVIHDCANKILIQIALKQPEKCGEFFCELDNILYNRKLPAMTSPI